MIPDEVSDYRAQSLLKRFVRLTGDKELQERLKGILLCGTGLLPTETKAVYVLRHADEDGEFKHVSLSGVTRCHSAWSCPYCTARVMAEKGRRIAAAIEALKSKQSAAMITFTVPHLYDMSAKTTFKILRETWRLFVKQGHCADRKRKYTRKDGETVEYSFCKDPFSLFRSKLGMKHHVRVYEFTWGRNSWHPHIHGLFWFDNNKFDTCVEYEQILRSRWIDCFYAAITKQLGKTVADNLKRINNDAIKRGNSGGLFISKDKHGRPLKMQSSMYLTGWSANSEVTGQAYKTAQPGHYTPQQIFDKALKATDWETATKWLSLYVEYAVATRGTRRLQWAARTGINKIIDDWLATHDLESLTKKKSAYAQVVAWFTAEQWFIISNYEAYIRITQKRAPNFDDEKFDAIYQIIKRARLPNATEAIVEYVLEITDIDISKNVPTKFVTSMIEQIEYVA